MKSLKSKIMKKHKILLALLCAAPGLLLAQPQDSTKVDVEIEDNRVILKADDLEQLSRVDLNKIVREVAGKAREAARQQREVIQKIKAREEAGEITAEEAELLRLEVQQNTAERMAAIGQMMEKWGEAYEERMEKWEEEFEARMESWEKDMDRKAARGEGGIPPLPEMPPLPEIPEIDSQEQRDIERRVRIDKSGVHIERGGSDEDRAFALRWEEEQEQNAPKAPKKEKSIDRSDGYFDINFGFNQMLRNGQSMITSGQEELHFWKSTAFELGVGQKTRIGSPQSKLYLRYGGEFSWHNFRLQGGNTLQKQDDLSTIAPDTTRSINMSKYHIAYFNLPVMLQLDFSRPGKMDDSFTLGVGGYGGVRINAKRKLEFSSNRFENSEEKIKDDFYTQQFRYGLMAQVGWDSFKITARYDLNPFFQQNRGPNYQMAQITLGFAL